MPKVSVIVPVYNVEEYLDKCLNSLVNQTLKDIEIIVVNDGSPDNSQDIIDKYVKKYPKKVKSFVKKNGGLSDARNYGIKHAKGEYIAFLDSDDWAELDTYEIMYKKAISRNFDIVVCDLFYIFDNYTKKAFSNVEKDLFDKEQIKSLMINIYPVAWNKIYNRKLFDLSIRFKKGVWYEDVEFLYRLLPHINSIGVVKKPLINYLQRPGAITKIYNEKLFHYIDNWNGVIDYYKENNLYEEYKDELEYSYVRYLFATLIKNAAKSKNKEMFNDAIKKTIKNVKEKFPNYKNNKYIKASGLKGFYLSNFNSFFAKIIFFLEKIKTI